MRVVRAFSSSSSAFLIILMINTVFRAAHSLQEKTRRQNLQITKTIHRLSVKILKCGYLEKTSEKLFCNSLQAVRDIRDRGRQTHSPKYTVSQKRIPRLFLAIILVRTVRFL